MLANELSSFTLTLEKFKAENAYFRALYIQIQEQDKMLALHKHASNVFSMDANPAYKAHVSLLYGNYPQELKEASMKSLSMPSTRNFLVNSIHLYRTEGETSDWYRVQEFKFSR
jgi:2'-5' RNA ligase